MIPRFIPVNTSTAPISFIGTASSNASALDFSTVPYQIGDLMIRVNRLGTSAGAGSVQPAGWNTIYSWFLTDSRHSAFWKYAETTTETDPTDTANGGRNRLYVFRNAKVKAGSVVENPMTSATTSYVVPALTVNPTAGEWGIACHMIRAQQASGWQDVAKPAGTTAIHTSGTETSPGFYAHNGGVGTGWSTTTSTCLSTARAHSAAFILERD